MQIIASLFTNVLRFHRRHVNEKKVMNLKIPSIMNAASLTRTAKIEMNERTPSKLTCNANTEIVGYPVHSERQSMFPVEREQI